MRWEDREVSSNVEDRRESDNSVAGGSGGGKMPSLGTVMMFWPIIRPLLQTKFGWTLIIGGVFLLLLWGINPFRQLGWEEGTPPKGRSDYKLLKGSRKEINRLGEGVRIL